MVQQPAQSSSTKDFYIAGMVVTPKERHFARLATSNTLYSSTGEIPKGSEFETSIHNFFKSNKNGALYFERHEEEANEEKNTKGNGVWGNGTSSKIMGLKENKKVVKQVKLVIDERKLGSKNQFVPNIKLGTLSELGFKPDAKFYRSSEQVRTFGQNSIQPNLANDKETSNFNDIGFKEDKLIDNKDNSTSEKKVSTKIDDTTKIKPKSWASLVSKNLPTNTTAKVIYKGITNNNENPSKINGNGKNNDRPQNLIELFDHLKIFTKPSPKVIRGFMNSNNLCYANSVLQSLFSCSAFFNLLKMISNVINNNDHESVEDLPVLNTLIEIYNEFKPCQFYQTKQISNNESIHSSKAIDLIHKLGGEFSTMIGTQQDAPEFYSRLLNTLSDEFETLFQKHAFQLESKLSRPSNQNYLVIEMNRTDNIKEDNTNDDSEWVSIDTKHKAYVAREYKFVTTPITTLFTGQYHSILKSKGRRAAVSMEPALCLQLSILDDEIEDLQGAIQKHFELEQLTTFSSLGTSQTKQYGITKLPPILCLQLMRFVHDNKKNMFSKLNKVIEYPMELEFKVLTNSVVLSTSNNTKSSGQRDMDNTIEKYKLQSVIYHHGESFFEGHYTVDVNYNEVWYHCNDESVERLESLDRWDSNKVMPYMFFYCKV